MARILILGADGMVGHIARLYLSEHGHHVLSIARSSSPDWDLLDVENENALFSYIVARKPEIILNCVGVLINESEENPERAIRLNALLPRTLSRKGKEFGYRLIHISSDCVFSGESGPYCENDRCDANNVYGRTKALGEIVNSRDLTIRTSKVGPELKMDGSGLFNWFMNQRGQITGYTQAMWGGVTTLELAKAVDFIINNPITGLLHLTNNEAISKCALLELFSDIWGHKDIIIKYDGSKSINRSLLCTRNDFAYKIPTYRAMLEEMHEFMLIHLNLYRDNYRLDSR